MKKFFIILGIIVLSFIVYLIYDEVSYSPLDKKALSKIFGTDNLNYRLKCSEDFIGWSSDGAIFDFYIYDIEISNIDTINYPNFNDKTGKNVTWTSVPVDSSLYDIDPLIFSFKTDACECQSIFIKEELQNSKSSYYSYNVVDERESHFYLYNAEENKLYYVRRKGF